MLYDGMYPPWSSIACVTSAHCTVPGTWSKTNTTPELGARPCTLSRRHQRDECNRTEDVVVRGDPLVVVRACEGVRGGCVRRHGTRVVLCKQFHPLARRVRHAIGQLAADPVQMSEARIMWPMHHVGTDCGVSSV